MLFKFSRFVLVVLLCMSLGLHWAFLQSVAWAGMMVNFSCQGSFKDAVTKTFDGRHPCPLCKLVREGKKQEKKSEAQQNARMLDLFAGKAAAFDFPPPPVAGFPPQRLALSRSDVPPLPPPRPFFG